MIWIFNLERASAGSCDTYDDLFDYICQCQERYPELVQPLDTHQQFAALAHLPANQLNETSGEAVKRQLCFEFCKRNNYVILETPSPTPSQMAL